MLFRELNRGKCKTYLIACERTKKAVRNWLAMTRPAEQVSPDGTRRPYWLLRPLKPAREVYRLPAADTDKRVASG